MEIQRFHEPHWLNRAWLNNRTHRKVLVVDGIIAFTGGVGISDLWADDAQDPAPSGVIFLLQELKSTSTSRQRTTAK